MKRSSIFHRDNITLDAAVISIGSTVLASADEAIPQGGRVDKCRGEYSSMSRRTDEDLTWVSPGLHLTGVAAGVLTACRQLNLAF